MEPVSGEVVTNNRTDIDIHGGGRDPNGALTHSLDNVQPLTPTQGCVRALNVDVNELIDTINLLARSNEAVTNVFIGDTATLNAQADEKDQNGIYLYQELRNAGFGTPDAQGRPPVVPNNHNDVGVYQHESCIISDGANWNPAHYDIPEWL